MYNKNKLSAFVLVLGAIFLFSSSGSVFSKTTQTSGKSFSKAGSLSPGGFFSLTGGRNPNINKRHDKGSNYNERSREGDRYRDRGERNDHDRDRYERRDNDRNRDGDGYRHEREHRRRDRD